MLYHGFPGGGEHMNPKKFICMEIEKAAQSVSADVGGGLPKQRLNQLNPSYHGIGGLSMRGMTRALDNLGRIVIPKEIQTAYHIEPEDLMQIEVVSNGILLKPAKTTCVVCGSSKGILTAADVGICR